jgi:hypothetical protein
MWRKKQRVTVPDDLNEARELKHSADVDLDQLKSQETYVVNLTNRLIARKKLNHFGDAAQLTFTSRGH